MYVLHGWKVDSAMPTKMSRNTFKPPTEKLGRNTFAYSKTETEKQELSLLSG